MNSLAIVMVIALVGFTAAEKYTSRYDNFNVDEALENPKLVEGYSNCMLDKGKCTPEGKELKAHIREALENKCADCTDKQKEMGKKVIRHMINKEKAIWDELKAKYDPTDKYSTLYEKELREVLAAR